MAYWELERGPDGLLDLLRDGAVVQVAMDERQVEDVLKRRKADHRDWIDVPDERGIVRQMQVGEYLDR